MGGVAAAAVAFSMLLAAPVLAAKLPAPPPLPPLLLDAAAPVVTMFVDGAPLRLRVDPSASRHVEINAAAAARLGLADPARLVGGKPATRGRASTQVGKVRVNAATSDAIVQYAGRDLPLTLAWSAHDPVAGADGLIGPWQLPYDVVRLVRRPVTPGDRMTHLPMRWDSDRGLLGEVQASADNAAGAQGAAVDIDIAIAPVAAESTATAAAASLLAAGHGGRLMGPARDLVLVLGVVRPVRDLVFAHPVDVAGVRLERVAARVFDWSGQTNIPDADLLPGEAVVAGHAGAQREWAKLAIGNDHLAACAEIVWTRLPLAIDLVCPALP